MLPCGTTRPLGKTTDHYKGINGTYPIIIKRNRKMSTCNELDLETLGSQPVLPKNLTKHCTNVIVIQYKQAILLVVCIIIHIHNNVMWD